MKKKCYNIIGDNMKKLFTPIVLLLITAFISFVVLMVKGDNILTKEQAIKIGEEKYLMFLWMVDGAYNSSRFNEDFMVNGKTISKENVQFTCEYKSKKDKECVGNNFESEFKNLFSKKINYEKVYSDGAIYSWISRKDNNYVFNNVDTCNINRMGINHELKVTSISLDKIEYEVTFDNRKTNGLNKRDFILVKEDNEWKVSNAFYYDLCGLKYFIY